MRQAVPNLDQVLNGQGLFDLACRDDAESRLVHPVRGNWQRQLGPFDPAALEPVGLRREHADSASFIWAVYSS